MKRKILNISDSPLIRNYLKSKVEQLDIDFINTRDGLDGLIKMRNLHPDLLIMDFNVPRMTLNQFLNDKHELKGTQDIPIVLFYSKNDPIDKNLILKLARSKIFKLILKPIDIDKVIASINSLFKVKISIDSNECQLDINLNDNILFIEISKGLNKEKIELMKYKIFEMKKQTKMNSNKVLIIMSDINHQNNTNIMLDDFMYNILNATGSSVKDITVFTQDRLVKKYYSNHRNYQYLNITENYNETMNNIKSGKKALTDDTPAYNESDYSQRDFDNLINLNFQPVGKKTADYPSFGNKKRNIAILNNDSVINKYIKNLFMKKGWRVDAYSDERLFLHGIKQNIPDLIFLDIALSKINGFELLKYLRANYSRIPVIVLTSSNNKEHIIKAKNYGVKHYLIEPFNSEIIVKKTEEVLSKLG